MERKVKVIILISAFFFGIFIFPKSAGSTCGFCPSAPNIQRTEFGCVGFKQDILPDGDCIDCGRSIVCYGIPTGEKKCYTRIDNSLVEVPGCRNPETFEEITAICQNNDRCLLLSASQSERDTALALCERISDAKLKDECTSYAGV